MPIKRNQPGKKSKRVPVHLNHHLFVENGKIDVMNQTISGGNGRPAERLQRGDKVTFTTNNPAAELYYEEVTGRAPAHTQSGSPFGNELPPGPTHTHNVADGVKKGKVFRVKTACSFPSHFTFVCGLRKNGKFERLRYYREGGTEGGNPAGGNTQGGNTPGPND